MYKEKLIDCAQTVLILIYVNKKTKKYLTAIDLMKNLYKAPAIIIKLIVFFLLLYPSFSNAQSISVMPTTLTFNLSTPGNTQTQTINIINNSNETQAVEIYFGDWMREIDGKHIYYAPGTQPYSCSKWANSNTNFLEIEPNSSKQVTVTLQAPENAEDLEKMKWSMLFIQSAKVKQKSQQMREGLNTLINEIVRMGIHIYQVPNAINSLSARAVNLTENSTEKSQYDFEIENNGQLMVRTSSFLELTNVETGEEFKSQIEECPIFPLAKRIVSLHLPDNLPKGKYSMLAVLDYGDPNSLEAVERTIEIK